VRESEEKKPVFEPEAMLYRFLKREMGTIVV
jgi:hypothetical protein